MTARRAAAKVARFLVGAWTWAFVGPDAPGTFLLWSTGPCFAISAGVLMGWVDRHPELTGWQAVRFVVLFGIVGAVGIQAVFVAIVLLALGADHMRRKTASAIVALAREADEPEPGKAAPPGSLSPAEQPAARGAVTLAPPPGGGV